MWLAIAAVLSVAWAVPHRFDPAVTHLIDYSAATNSFLFRGNEPVENMTFAWDDLVSSLRNASAKVGGPKLPDSIYLVDINLLEVERTSIDIEVKFFAKNPKLGVFVHRPIFGSISNPLDFPKAVRDALARDLDDWSHDKLPSLMAWIRKSLTSTYRNTVLYIHCEGGEDRTGEVSGSYYMTYLNMTFEEALAIDNGNTNRDIHCESARELMWYCFYMQLHGANVGSCEPQNKTYCAPD